MSSFLEKDIKISAQNVGKGYVNVLDRRRLAAVSEALSGLRAGGWTAVCGDGFGESAGRFAWEVYRGTGGGDRLRFMTRAELETALTDRGPDGPGRVIMFCLEGRDETAAAILELANRAGADTAVLSPGDFYREMADVLIRTPEGGGTVEGYALLLAHAALCALALCVENGEADAGRAGEILDAGRRYLEGADLGEIMSRARDAAGELKKGGVRCLDLVGEGTELAALDLCRLLAVRERGIICMTENSEDWHHINFFERSASEILTILICDGGSPSFSRCGETALIAAQIGRPVAVITDIEGWDLPGGLAVYTPAPRGAPLWAETLLQLLPAALIALEGSAPAT